MKSANRSAAGPSLPVGQVQSASATQAAWRFLNNPRVELAALAEPLRDAGRQACEQNDSAFVLLAHNWCKLNDKSHASKNVVRQITHADDVGYDLLTALLIDARGGYSSRRWPVWSFGIRSVMNPPRPTKPKRF
ncbi:hypothetical protein [Thalassoroseus pseudoceratinae]|uniref:hypothetical protein n=1 Tax=Thalassoroseus pseudoceratinae TaxID=2713176 RepID=UPI0014237A8D|nr:hypothetical protein [Thalassoroseus pseudoceratinae]